MTKGFKGFQKGYKLSEEAKKRIGIVSKNRKRLIGWHHSEEIKRKISEGNKNKIVSEETRKKMSESRKKYFLEHPEYKEKINTRGKHWILSKETRERMRGRKGKLCPAWKGGISKMPYPYEFNEFLKKKIREKYHNVCQLCGMVQEESVIKYNRKLCVNHIDFDKNNCNEENLNLLCVACNIKINNKRELYTHYFNRIAKVNNFWEYSYE